MSVSLSLTCFISPSKSHLRTNLSRLNSPRITIPLLPPRPKNHNPPIIRCIHEKSDHLPVIQTKPRWEDILSTAASLYPVYVTVGGAVAVIKPSAYAWFVQRGPASYTLSIGLIMLAMGLTLKIRDLVGLFMQRPVSYTIMPAFGVLISKLLALPPSLSVGLILLSCCPGGTASNVVTFIAQGDVPLSIVMTMFSTLGAVLLTPLLTKIWAGTFVPVDAVKLSLSILQVVVAPVLLGPYLQSTFPAAVKVVTPYAPLLAVLTSSLLACSVFSENVIRIKSSMTGASLLSEASVSMHIQSLLSGELGSLLLSVVLLHSAGFFVGYLSAAIIGFKERQRRAISIEVGMQNSSLGVVLAASHFNVRFYFTLFVAFVS